MLVKIGIDLDHSFDGINIVSMKEGDVFEFEDREGREIVDRFSWAEEYNEEEEDFDPIKEKSESTDTSNEEEKFEEKKKPVSKSKKAADKKSKPKK